MTSKYDLIVIGGGSGGRAQAQRAAEYGAKAAVVEGQPLGGTCVNVGCVPKKIMWYTAHQAHQFEHAAGYGFDIAVNGHSWAALKRGRDSYVTRLNGIYANNLDKRGVQHIEGWARITGFNTLMIDERDPYAHGFLLP